MNKFSFIIFHYNTLEETIACELTKFSLLIAGTGYSAYVEMLKYKCQKLRNIHFMKKIKKEAFCRKIDLLVVPSIWEEPFERIVVEPFAAGIPVIAASGEIPEILKGYKVGLLYNPFDIKELTAQLNDFMSGVETFDISKKEDFMSRFATEKIAQEYLNVFKEVCKSKILGKGGNNA